MPPPSAAAPATSALALAARRLRRVSPATITNADAVAAAKAALPPAFRPSKPAGIAHHRMPKYSALDIARLRRKVVANGGVWPYDVPKKEVYREVSMKGRKRDVEKLERKETIAKNMERMPQLVEEYRKKVKELKKPKPALWSVLNVPEVELAAGGKKKK